MNISPSILVIDYVLGVVMWTLIGRAAMNFFQKEDSEFFFMKAFVKLTNPIIRMFHFITPGFLIKPMVPLYVAWFFYHVSFLFDALSVGVFSYGDAFFSSRKRNHKFFGYPI